MHMKNFYLIGGTMGTGKTTISQALKKKLNRAVLLDGDWCWDADPFIVTDETKRMVLDNICYLLNNFIQCTPYENIIFCWVMHEQYIIDEILSRLDTRNCRVIPVSLICREEALRKRLQRDIESGLRTPSITERSLARLPLYECLHTIKLDVSELSPEEAADRISGL